MTQPDFSSNFPIPGYGHVLESLLADEADGPARALALAAQYPNSACTQVLAACAAVQLRDVDQAAFFARRAASVARFASQWERAHTSLILQDLAFRNLDPADAKRHLTAYPFDLLVLDRGMRAIRPGNDRLSRRLALIAQAVRGNPGHWYPMALAAFALTVGNKPHTAAQRQAKRLAEESLLARPGNSLGLHSLIHANEALGGVQQAQQVGIDAVLSTTYGFSGPSRMDEGRFAHTLFHTVLVECMATESGQPINGGPRVTTDNWPTLPMRRHIATDSRMLGAMQRIGIAIPQHVLEEGVRLFFGQLQSPSTFVRTQALLMFAVAARSGRRWATEQLNMVQSSMDRSNRRNPRTDIQDTLEGIIAFGLGDDAAASRLLTSDASINAMRSAGLVAEEIGSILFAATKLSVSEIGNIASQPFANNVTDAGLPFGASAL